MHPIFSRRTAVLVLVCSLVLMLTACGTSPQTEHQAPPDAVPGPEPIPAETIGEQPFSSYFTLDGLPQTVLAACSQTVDQTSTVQNETIHVQQVLGDIRSLYVAFEVRDTAAPGQSEPDEKQAQNEENAPPSLLVSLHDGSASSSLENPDVNLTQIDAHNFLAIAVFHWETNRTANRTLTLQVSLSPDFSCHHTISWTDTTASAGKTVPLTTQQGKEAGTVSLSPLGAYFDLTVPSEEGSTLTLLNAQGQPLEPNATLNFSSDTQTYFMFYTPLDIAAVSQLTYGSVSAALS